MQRCLRPSLLVDEQHAHGAGPTSGIGVTFGRGDDRSLHEDVPRARERCRLSELGLLREATHDRADVLEMPDAGIARRVLRAHLQEYVDERAGLEVVTTEPLVEEVEDREQPFLGSRAALSGLGLDPFPRPPLLTTLEEREHEIVLRREVPVERRLGDTGACDHLVDPDPADTPAREQLGGGRKHAFAGVDFDLDADRVAGSALGHGRDATPRQTCLSLLDRSLLTLLSHPLPSDGIDLTGNARAAEQLRRLQALTDAALAHLGLDELLDTLLERVREILAADTAAILLLDEESDELVATAAKGLEEEVRQGVRISSARGFAGRVAAEGRPVILDRVDHTTVLNPILVETGIRSMVGAPLIADGSTIGVLHVGTLGARTFGPEDAELLQLAADRAALAISAEISEHERLAAATLQRSLAPRGLPDIAGMALAARYLPGRAGTVGGDWFDVFRLPTGHVAVAIGDVAGHGLRSAVVMGRLRSALRAYSLDSLDPAAVLTRLDEMVCQFEPDTMATVLYAVFDPALERLTLSSAGHPRPVIAEPDVTSSNIEMPVDPPIGSGLGIGRRDTTVRVPAGTTLYFFTDGLVERRGVDLDACIERLCAVATCGPPNAGCTRIITELVADAEPADDVALLALAILG